VLRLLTERDAHQLYVSKRLKIVMSTMAGSNDTFAERKYPFRVQNAELNNIAKV
jgi:hypothetical protein